MNELLYPRIYSQAESIHDYRRIGVVDLTDTADTFHCYVANGEKTGIGGSD